MRVRTQETKVRSFPACCARAAIGRAAEQRHELAPVQRAILPVLPRERIARPAALRDFNLGYVCCGSFTTADTATYAGLFLPTMETAAHSLAVPLTVSPIHDSAGIERAFASAASQPNGGLVLLPDAFTWAIRRQVVAQAARYRLPAIYQYGHIAREGGLMSYGISLFDVFRQTATYVDRILNGAKPADLPVQLPTKFELVINLKTAKALGLEVPPTLLARADEVIE
jgi:putative ABC transport system substrate-binding protein